MKYYILALFFPIVYLKHPQDFPWLYQTIQYAFRKSSICFMTVLWDNDFPSVKSLSLF